MALNQMFAYKALRASSVTASLFHSGIVSAQGAIVLDNSDNSLKLNIAADRGLSVVSNMLGIKLDAGKGLSTDNNGLAVDLAQSMVFDGQGNIDIASSIFGSKTFMDDVTVSGNLTVNGNVTYVNSTTVDIADKLIHLNKADIDPAGMPVPVGYTGVVIERGNEAGAAAKRDSVGIVWDEANSKFIAAMLDAADTPVDSKVDVEVAKLWATEGIDLAAGKTMMLNAGSQIDSSVTGKAAALISFSKASNLNWGANDPSNVYQALNDLADMIKDALSTAESQLELYFNDLRSNGILGTSDVGAVSSNVLTLFAGGRVAYVGGFRFPKTSIVYDASAIDNGSYKLYLDANGDVQYAPSYPVGDEIAKLGTITVAAGVVTSFADEHLGLTELDQTVATNRHDFDAFVSLIASATGAANVGVSNAVAADFSLQPGATVEDVLAAIHSALNSASSALAAEITRAEAAEAQIASDLAAEVTRAQGAEATLTSNLSAEVSRATAAEAQIASDLAAEVTRAQAAEAQIASDLAAEVTRAQGAESTLTSNLASEVSRAQAAESQIASDLASEVTRAQAAEATLTSDLASEVSRAQSAEATITTNLNNEISRAQSAENTITTNLNNEISRAQSAESTLTTNLAAEVTRAQAAEAQLTSDLAAEVTRAEAAEAQLTSDLAAEVTRAEAAEAQLTSDLAAEVTRAEAAEAQLTSDLAAEVTRAEAAEAQIASDLAAEVAARNAMKMQKVRYTITAGDVAAGVDYLLTLPTYVVGSEAILVFVDGQAEDRPDFYTEVDPTTIALNKDALIEGMKIMVWVTPFQG
jgi:hypothetical protein